MARLSHHDLQQMDEAWQDDQSEPVVRDLLKRVLNELRATLDHLNQTPHNSSRPPGSMPPWQRTAVAAAAAAAMLPGEADKALHDAKPSVEDASSQAPNGNAQEPPHDSAGAAGTPDQALPKDHGGNAHTTGTPSTDTNTDNSTSTDTSTNKQACTTPTAPARRPGRRVGACGHGREQKLVPTRTQEHRALSCAACGQTLPSDAPAQAWTGWDTLEMLPLGGLDGVGGAAHATEPSAPSVLGVRIEVTRHLLMQQRCACGHTTRAQALRADDNALWPGVQLSQQRLLGPRLAAAVVHLCVRMRLPRRKVAELLLEWFGLELSPALIDQTVHQAARSVAPLEQQLAADLEQAVLLHADETPWMEAGLALWLWVLCSCHTVLYVIGARTKEMFDNALSLDFAGRLMTDGFAAYRSRLLRLRCWAHLHRKLRGLAQSCERHTAQAGSTMLLEFEFLMAAVFEARKWAQRPPPATQHADRLVQLRRLCEQHLDAPQKALRELAREFLNDWDVIVLPLHDPRWPLTNNAAERQLRHYVIARRISYGTRTEVGSHSIALLASIIDTCRLRRASATGLLAQAIHAARMGLPTPALPPIPADLSTHSAAFPAA